ncbi:hypothetical protein BV898_06684 [Hypsibius exemplaris]|uniref:Uncharacterized protein n=1 Tax=Hypsibius exemplaris TaxID=2072580 RepID=A0A1W0WVN5_HYPEX|nr:hypothetical protein BV898_06684 [Hypsibius exemplaris]
MQRRFSRLSASGDVGLDCSASSGSSLPGIGSPFNTPLHGDAHLAIMQMHAIRENATASARADLLPYHVKDSPLLDSSSSTETSSVTERSPVHSLILLRQQVERINNRVNIPRKILPPLHSYMIGDLSEERPRIRPRNHTILQSSSTMLGDSPLQAALNQRKLLPRPAVFRPAVLETPSDASLPSSSIHLSRLDEAGQDIAPGRTSSNSTLESPLSSIRSLSVQLQLLETPTTPVVSDRSSLSRKHPLSASPKPRPSKSLRLEESDRIGQGASSSGTSSSSRRESRDSNHNPGASRRSSMQPPSIASTSPSRSIPVAVPSPTVSSNKKISSKSSSSTPLHRSTLKKVALESGLTPGQSLLIERGASVNDSPGLRRQFSTSDYSLSNVPTNDEVENDPNYNRMENISRQSSRNNSIRSSMNRDPDNLEDEVMEDFDASDSGRDSHQSMRSSDGRSDQNSSRRSSQAIRLSGGSIAASVSATSSRSSTNMNKRSSTGSSSTRSSTLSRQSSVAQSVAEENPDGDLDASANHHSMRPGGRTLVTGNDGGDYGRPSRGVVQRPSMHDYSIDGRRSNLLSQPALLDDYSIDEDVEMPPADFPATRVSTPSRRMSDHADTPSQQPSVTLPGPETVDRQLRSTRRLDSGGRVNPQEFALAARRIGEGRQSVPVGFVAGRHAALPQPPRTAARLPGRMRQSSLALDTRSGDHLHQTPVTTSQNKDVGTPIANQGTPGLLARGMSFVQSMLHLPVTTPEHHWIRESDVRDRSPSTQSLPASLQSDMGNSPMQNRTPDRNFQDSRSRNQTPQTLDRNASGRSGPSRTPDSRDNRSDRRTNGSMPASAFNRSSIRSPLHITSSQNRQDRVASWNESPLPRTTRDTGMSPFAFDDELFPRALSFASCRGGLQSRIGTPMSSILEPHASFRTVAGGSPRVSIPALPNHRNSGQRRASQSRLSTLATNDHQTIGSQSGRNSDFRVIMDQSGMTEDNGPSAPPSLIVSPEMFRKLQHSGRMVEKYGPKSPPLKSSTPNSHRSDSHHGDDNDEPDDSFSPPIHETLPDEEHQDDELPNDKEDMRMDDEDSSFVHSVVHPDDHTNNTTTNNNSYSGNNITDDSSHTITQDELEQTDKHFSPEDDPDVMTEDDSMVEQQSAIIIDPMEVIEPSVLDRLPPQPEWYANVSLLVALVRLEAGPPPPPAKRIAASEVENDRMFRRFQDACISVGMRLTAPTAEQKELNMKMLKKIETSSPAAFYHLCTQYLPREQFGEVGCPFYYLALLRKLLPNFPQLLRRLLPITAAGAGARPG